MVDAQKARVVPGRGEKTWFERGRWDAVQEQVAAGRSEFLVELRGHLGGDEQEQRGAGRLPAVRLRMDAVMAAVERMNERPWAEFHDEYGDTRRDMTLYLGRRPGEPKLAELTEAVGLRNYAVDLEGRRHSYERFWAAKSERSGSRTGLTHPNLLAANDLTW